MQISLSLAREVKALTLDTREILECLRNDDNDFSVDDHRFIHEDDIMEDELGRTSPNSLTFPRRPKIILTCCL